MGITLWQSLADEASRFAVSAFADIHTTDDWQKVRPQRYREFMRSLGLDPLPPRCDLKVTEYAAATGDGFRVRNIAFQILPDCWSSASVYYPDSAPAAKLPGVLYVCGHAPIGVYHYQAHAIMWARRGYVCLIVDTIEQHDNPGEHHDSYVDELDRWLSLGYTSAGGETWNSLRAMDVLAADDQVDPERLAVTGVSGGGACSFYLAAIDERVKAVSTLCGVSTPLDAIANRHVEGHCSCFYPQNVGRRDISEYAALIAPRPALFCFADQDPLFHPDEIHAFVERTRRIYQLYGRDEHCKLVTCSGPHGDHPEFDDATAAWFDRHVGGGSGTHPSVTRGKRELAEPTTSTFHGQPPQPNRLELLPQLLSPRGTVALPQQPEDWPTIRQTAVEALRTHVFAGTCNESVTTTLAQTGDWLWAPDTLVRAHGGQIAGMDVHFQMVTSAEHQAKLVVSVADAGESWMHAMGRVGSLLKGHGASYGGFESRIGGGRLPTPHLEPDPPGSWIGSVRTNHLRAMAITGVTPAMMTVRDIGVLLDYLLALDEFQKHQIYLYGKGDAGVAALYCGVLDERITGVIVDGLPGSHLHGSPILGILRTLDLPQAVGLMAPRKVALVNPGHNFWTWPTRAFERVGCPERLMMASDLRQALDAMLVDSPSD